MVAESHPDGVLLDLDLDEERAETDSGALELLGNLRKSDYQPHVIVLADPEDTSRCMQAVLLGAVGVVLRDQTGSVLKKAIEKVQAGEVWLERSLTANVLREFTGPSSLRNRDPNVARINSLSGREREVVALVCEGLANRDIGARLAISEATVRHHLTSIFNKIAVQNRLELVIFAYRHNLNRPDKLLRDTIVQTPHVIQVANSG